jgi:RimJ/RimL family protein N-acetyltransferase
MQPIVTVRLILRNFLWKDVSGLYAYLSKPRVNCFSSGKIETIEDARKEIEKRSQRDDSIAVCLKATDEVIGDLFFKKKEPDTYSVGWNFNIEYQGKGYAFESAKALLMYLFRENSARRIYAYVEDDNNRSQKLCERLGMRNEGCFKEFISFVNNPDGTPKYENTMQYAILKKEWETKL